MNYWILKLWDGEEIKVKPDNVKLIQDKISTGEGAITTPNRSILVKNIRDFVESDDLYTDQKLIEDSARAFKEALINPDESVVIRWVKKDVTKRQWDKYYSQHIAYKKLNDSDSHVTIAWKQPVHLINPELMSELSQEDELNMSKRV